MTNKFNIYSLFLIISIALFFSYSGDFYQKIIQVAGVMKWLFFLPLIANIFILHSFLSNKLKMNFNKDISNELKYKTKKFFIMNYFKIVFMLIFSMFMMDQLSSLNSVSYSPNEVSEYILYSLLPFLLLFFIKKPKIKKLK